MVSFVQALLLFLVILSYLFVFTRFAAIFGIIIGTVNSILRAISGVEKNPGRQKIIAQLETTAGILFSIGFVIAAFIMNWWEMSWIKLWASPPLITVVFIVAVLQVMYFEGFHPLLRTAAKGTLLMMWPPVVLIMIGSFNLVTISTEIFKWGVTVSAAVSSVIAFYTIARVPRRLSRTESLRQRHNNLQSSIEDTNRVTSIVGSNEVRERMDTAFETITNSYSQARKELERGDLDEAEAHIIQVEQTLEEVRGIFENRVSLSLQDELETRLSPAEEEVEDLIYEVEDSELSIDALEYLYTDIEEIQCTLEDFNFDEPTDDELADLVQRFDDLFGEINDIRTALRFRENVNSTIDDLTQEIEDKGQMVELAEHLDISTNDLAELKYDLETELEQFQSSSIKSSDDLVRSFQSIQRKVAEFRQKVELLSSQIQEEWQTRTLGSDFVTMYIPNYCHTTEPTRGAIVVEFSEDNDAVAVNVDGTLIELFSDQRIELESRNNQDYSISHFPIAGKRGGTATLTCRFDDLEVVSGPISFNIRVIPSVREIAQRSVIYASSLGATVAGAAFWRFNLPLKKSASIGFIGGGLIAIIIFVIKYIRLRGRPF